MEVSSGSSRSPARPGVRRRLRPTPLLDKTRATEHCCDEIRRVKTTTVTRGPGFPHAIEALQIVSRRRNASTCSADPTVSWRQGVR